MTKEPASARTGKSGRNSKSAPADGSSSKSQFLPGAAAMVRRWCGGRDRLLEIVRAACIAQAYSDEEIEGTVRHAAELWELRLKRGTKHSTLSELKRAVREECQAHVDYHLARGSGEGERIGALLVMFQAVDPRPREVWEKLARALKDATDLADAPPSGFPDVPECRSRRTYMDELRTFLERCNTEQQCQIAFWREVVEKDERVPPGWPLHAAPEGLGRRGQLLSFLAQPDHFWWHGTPRARDLAILTLLAGEFPRGMAAQQKGQAITTVADVIEAEAKAVRLNCKRLGLLLAGAN